MKSVFPPYFYYICSLPFRRRTHNSKGSAWLVCTAGGRRFQGWGWFLPSVCSHIPECWPVTALNLIILTRVFRSFMRWWAAPELLRAEWRSAQKLRPMCWMEKKHLFIPVTDENVQLSRVEYWALRWITKHLPPFTTAPFNYLPLSQVFQLDNMFYYKVLKCRIPHLSLTCPTIQPSIFQTAGARPIQRLWNQLSGFLAVLKKAEQREFPGGLVLRSSG